MKCSKKLIFPVGITAAILAVGVAAWIGLRSKEKNERSAVRVTGAHKDHSDAVKLLHEKCIDCHGPKKQEGELRLDSLAGILLGGKSGPAMKVGDAKKSLMVHLMHHTEKGKEMPPKKKLRREQINLVADWIDDGAKWNKLDDEIMADVHQETFPDHKATLGDAWSDPNNPIAKLFAGKRIDLWSFQKISNPPVPAVKDVSWVRNPIDSFILAEIEKADQKPAPEADKRTLIRRLYFDLTGLPPAPEEVEAFVADSSAEAYSKLVTKLLESKKYGEHWARFWLDVVRYSDSNGFDYDEFRPQAWTFRDYVIRSLNQDKPYDRFVREQLAGDEMVAEYPETPEEQDCLAATGYMRIGPFDNSAAKFGEEERCRAQVMFDLVETTGAAFCGLNLICCRCHDHKLDPISQMDYYRLRAFFETVAPNDKLTLDLAPEQKIIQKEMAAVAEKKAQMDAVTALGADRVMERKILKLPEDDQRFLAQYAKQHTVEEKGRYKTLKQLFEATPAEAEDALTTEEKKQRDALKAELTDLEGKCSARKHGFLVTDSDKAVAPTRLLKQGDFARPAEIVEAGVFAAFNPNPTPPAKTKRAESSGLRSALVDWLFAESNPLTARVMANRIWLQHFGEGLQPTPNDYGFAGARPTNPALLDWLATEFRRSGWSLKKMHRLMVESSTYRQGIARGEGVPKSLFIGQAPRRLTAEGLRDSMLSVAGELKERNGGPPVWPKLPQEIISSSPGLLVENEEKTRGWYPSPPEDVKVRSIYLVQKRSLRLPMLETFDLPENNLSCGRRIVSTVAPQALTLLNSEFAVETAEAFAARLKKEAGEDETKQLKRAFALCFQRIPDPAEVENCLAFLKKHTLPELCRSLLNLNEFAYID